MMHVGNDIRIHNTQYLWYRRMIHDHVTIAVFGSKNLAEGWGQYHRSAYSLLVNLGVV